MSVPGASAPPERVRRLSPLVRVVLAPNPSPLTLEGTNTYLIGNGDGVVVLDPGPADEEHLDRIAAEAGRVSLVLLSHWHPDHAEAADEFAARVRAPVAAAASAGRDAAIPLEDGRVVDGPGARLRALHTPGHASDHLCFVLEEEGVLFTGDHILGFGTTVVAHPDGDMEAYLASLDRLRAIEVGRMYPGHGPVIEHPRAVLEYYIAHRLEREEQVIAAVGDVPRTVEDLVAEIYAEVDPELHPVAAMTVRAHLAKLARDGRAREQDDGWRRA